MIPVCCFAEEAATADVAEEPAPRRTGKVATLYLNVSNANPKYPHCWLYFVNETDEPIQVGYYTVPAGDSVSVGNFRDRGNGSGIYYNLERYWVKEATYGRTFSMSTSVSAGEAESNASRRALVTREAPVTSFRKFLTFIPVPPFSQCHPVHSSPPCGHWSPQVPFRRRRWRGRPKTQGHQ